MRDMNTVITPARTGNSLCPKLKSLQVIYHLCLLMVFLHSQMWLSSSPPLTAVFYDL